MTRRSARCRVLSSLAVAVLLTGCSAGASPTPAPTPALTPQPTPVAAPTAAPTPGRTPPPAVLSSPMPVTVAHVLYTPPVPCATYSGVVTPCQLELFIYAPTSGGPWPLVVAVPGGPVTNVSDLGGGDVFGRAFAGQGAVLVVAQYREDIATDGGYPVTFQDIACAIGVARRIGPTYKADPTRVTLMGHSWGGWAGAVVALTPTPFTPDPGSCNPTSGSLRPDAFVGLDGAYSVAEDTSAFQLQVPSVYENEATRAAATAASDPYQLVRKYPAGAGSIPILLLQGTEDDVVGNDVPVRLQSALTTAGYHSSLWMVPGADHDGNGGGDSIVAWILAFAKGDVA
jgi:acetyl esterase/lipase